MKGKLYLSGGGYANQTYDADKIAFENVKTILYIPFAWDRDPSYLSCKTWFEEMLLMHNIKDYYLMTNPQENIDLEKFDMIYIGGGNTFKLLKELKESGLGKRIINYINNDGMVYGGSAGAIIFGKTINTATIGDCSDENNVNLIDLNGFSLLNFDIHCHYNKKDDNLIRKYINSNNKSVITISEESVVEVINGKVNRYLGNGIVKVFEK
jgi:dipeptidase E